jgi:hypothetical protein
VHRSDFTTARPLIEGRETAALRDFNSAYVACGSDSVIRRYRLNVRFARKRTRLKGARRLVRIYWTVKQQQYFNFRHSQKRQPRKEPRGASLRWASVRRSRAVEIVGGSSARCPAPREAERSPLYGWWK